MNAFGLFNKMKLKKLKKKNRKKKNSKWPPKKKGIFQPNTNKNMTMPTKREMQILNETLTKKKKIQERTQTIYTK